MLAMLTLIPLATGLVMGAFPAAVTYADTGNNLPTSSSGTGSWQTEICTCIHLSPMMRRIRWKMYSMRV
ncbi:hypothetical protein PC115_g24584 [Phytophthora cactorum]|uniref:Uncharacterized protein n=1 Tax=Phytophthora cactorum TaxID=29920 RepID=A0A8T1A9J8_9STRA|nr:hypothetical protein PC115_g24584 [Phytophthora cactorum]